MEADRSMRAISYSGQVRVVNFVNESGLYSLILGSELESAKKFKHWIINDIIPILRKESSMNTSNVPSLFNGKKVRIELRGVNGPWFCLSDVCSVLELTNPSKIKEQLTNQGFEDALTLSYPIDSLGRKQEATFINESALYAVILRSDKPQAIPFRKWVCNEVLPSIRKTGSYEIKRSDEGLSEITKVESALSLSVKAYDAFSRMGFTGVQLQSAANRIAKINTGVDLLEEGGIKLITDNIVLKPITGWLNTKSTKQAGEANRKLFELGYIDGTSGSWTLTEKGTELGGVMTFKNATGGGKQVCSIEWPEKVLSMLDK